ncbi:MAG TPA: glycosyltransferase family 1 protein, partial [Candidatus Paceibacterota bacterium]|nr:glycosyltransferase family 1 protein [Candidatus Paceibacterota bacterium]
MATRLRVLMSAYSCEPGKGSEPEVGWQWAINLARHHDLTVITRRNNADAIRARLADLPRPHPQFLFYDLPELLQRWKKTWLPVAVYYLIWQAAVR